MGNNNSVQKKLSNEEILMNINKLFGETSGEQFPQYTFNSIGMNNMEGGCIVPAKNRYASLEAQLGGELQNIQTLGMLNSFGRMLNQSGGDGIDVDSLSELEEDSDADLDDELLEGGCPTCLAGGAEQTSEMFMSEVMKMENISATSVDKQTGGCGACDKKSESLSSLSLMKSLNMEGGCPACNATQVIRTIEMTGGKPSSEEMNIMPFYSSTSGSEYYSSVQKEHRYN